VRFAHIADVHLGYEQYHLSFRADDFAKAFERVVESSLERDVDFVIIAGDLFHRSNPNPKAIKQAIEFLSQFKKENIPVFAIEGNHDKTIKEVSIYDLLESLGLLIRLGLRRKGVESEFAKVKKVGDFYLVKGVYDDVEIVGETHRSSHQFKAIVETNPYLKLDSDGILVLHQSIKEVVDIAVKDDWITIDYLPKANYYALGHVHIPVKKCIEDSWFVYPGCPERSEVKEFSVHYEYGDGLNRVDGVAKGFFVVENFKPKFVEVETRNLISATVYAKDQKDAVDKIREILAFVDSESLFMAKVLSGSNISVEELNELAGKRALYARINFEKLGVKRDLTRIEPNEYFDDFERALLEYLRVKDFDDIKRRVLEFVMKEFGLIKTKSIEEFEVKAKPKDVKKEEVKKAVKAEKPIKPKRRTLLDFLG